MGRTARHLVVPSPLPFGMKIDSCGGRRPRLPGQATSGGSNQSKTERARAPATTQPDCFSSLFHKKLSLPTAFAQHTPESFLCPVRASGKVFTDEAWECPEALGQTSRGVRDTRSLRG